MNIVKKKHDFSILNDTKFEKDIHYEKGLAHLGIMTTKVRIFQQFPGSQNGPKTVPAAALPLVRVLHPTFAAVPMVELTNGTHVQLGEVLQHHLPEKHGQKGRGFFCVFGGKNQPIYVRGWDFTPEFFEI